MNENETENIDNEALEEPTQRTVLLLWGSIFGEGLAAAAAHPIDIHVASKVVASWPFLTFKDVSNYHRIYHELLADFGRRVHEAIQANPDAIGWVGEEDGEHNHEIYKQLLVDWFVALGELEENWDSDGPYAAVLVAVIADVRAFLFSNMGLAGHLDEIKFKLSDDEFLEAVEEAKEFAEVVNGE